MKKSLFLILIAALLLSFGGCKTEPMTPTVPVETSTPTPAVTQQPTEPFAPKAGLLLRDKTTDEQDAIGLQDKLESLGYEVLAENAENDQARQNEQAAALLDAGCELLVLQPVMTTGLEELLTTLSGVPVVILDAQPELPEGMQNVAVLCPRQERAGTVLAELPAKLPAGGDLNGDGKTSVLLLQGPEDHMDSTARAEAFLLDPEAYVVLETVTGEWTEEGGRNSCAGMLAKYGPDLELIVTFGEEMAMGAVTAIENGGWVPGTDIYVITVGHSTTAINEVHSGRISGIAIPDPEARLQMLAELVNALTAGTPEEQTKYVDYITVAQ